MSIIPLDQGFYPYEVELANDGWDGDWQVNMTTGTRFTLMLKYVPTQIHDEDHRNLHDPPILFFALCDGQC